VVWLDRSRLVHVKLDFWNALTLPLVYWSEFWKAASGNHKPVNVNTSRLKKNPKNSKISTSHSRIRRLLANKRKNKTNFWVWCLMSPSYSTKPFQEDLIGWDGYFYWESDKRALIFLQPVQAPCFILVVCFIHNVFCKVWFVVCLVHNVFCDSVVRHAETYFMLLMTMMFLLSFSTLSVSISLV
jgi:hypothetical protein